MGNRLLAGMAAAALAAVLVPMAEAEAACRPRTPADLGPAPAHQQPATSTTLPPAPADVDPAVIETTTTTTATTTTALPATEEPAPAPAPTDPPADDPGTQPAEATPTEDAAPAPSPPPPPSCRFVYRMEFPVVGGGQIGSVFGDVRDGGDRWHVGVDIFAPKLTPVVAARAGTVTSIHDQPGDCCWVTLRHDDGWQSWYLHLNNDLPDTDDGLGEGIRSDLAVGMRIEAGQLLGWLGDSGNAETAVPHLHFELRTPAGVPVDPGPSLWSAQRRPASATADEEDGRPVFAGPFLDDDAHWLEPSIHLATSMGVSLWCDPWGLRVCPDALASRHHAFDWIRAFRDLPANAPVESNTSLALAWVEPEAAPVDPLLAVSGCLDPVFCAGAVTRGEVAALVLVAEDPAAPFDPSAALERLHREGRIDSCSPDGAPLDEPLSRAGLIHMLLRAFGHLPAPPCQLIS